MALPWYGCQTLVGPAHCGGLNLCHGAHSSLFNLAFFSILEQELRVWLQARNLNFLFVGFGLMALGSFCVAVAIRYGIRSIIGAIRPQDVPNLVDHVYKSPP